MIRRAVSLVLREPVHRIELVELLHPPVAIHFCQDRGRRDRDGSRVAVNQRLLLDGQIELDGIEQQIIRQGTQLRDRGDHRLPARLINVPRVNPARVNFGDGPGQRVFSNAVGQLGAALRRQFLRIVQADDPPPRIQHHGARHHRTEKRSAPRFIESSDAHPAALSRVALVPCRADPYHRRGF